MRKFLYLEKKEKKRIVRPTVVDSTRMEASPNVSTGNLPKTNGSEPAPFSKSELSSLIYAIPEYESGQNLSIFINEVENLLIHVTNRLTPDLAYLLSFSIRSKIKGEARDFISYQSCTTWEEIKQALLTKYGDQRSEELLVANLHQCLQRRNEHYLDYYARLMKAYNSLMQIVHLTYSSQAWFPFKKHEYTQLALKIFCKGVLEPYRTHLSHFEFNSIEECLNKCRTLDNAKQEWEYCEFLRKAQENAGKPTPPLFPKPNFQQQQFKSFNNNPFQNKPFQNSFQNKPFQNSFQNRPFQNFQKPNVFHNWNQNPPNWNKPKMLFPPPKQGFTPPKTTFPYTPTSIRRTEATF